MSHVIPPRVERIKKLIEKPSVSSAAPGWDQSNAGVIDELATWLDDLGFACERMAIPGEAGKWNLIATLGKGEGGLVLAGHTDTVPYDLARWTSDPFSLREHDGRLYGLGTCDMKGFLALALEAAEGLSADDLAHPLIVLATADEETTMSGAKALAARAGPFGRHAVIGEPTDLIPVRAHKGVLFERIFVHGQSGHSSDPRLGNSAIDGMARVLDALIRLRAELAETRNETFAVSVPTLNLGRVHGGDSANRIAAQCELDLDVRLLPGMDVDALRARILDVCERALAGTGLTVTREAIFHGVPAHELAADAPLVRACEALTEAASGTVAFGTEAPHLAALGADTVVLGPGSISLAHRPDEHLLVERLAPTVRILQGLVQRFCITP